MSLRHGSEAAPDQERNQRRRDIKNINVGVPVLHVIHPADHRAEPPKARREQEPHERVATVASDARTWPSGSPAAPATTLASDDTTTGAARPIATHNNARIAIAAHIGAAASCASPASRLRAEPRNTMPKALAKQAAASPLISPMATSEIKPATAILTVD